MAEDSQQVWGRVKADFIQVLGDHGLNDQVWHEMCQAIDAAGGSTATEESRSLYESFRLGFENKGIDPETAKRMAEFAARGHTFEPNLFG